MLRSVVSATVAALVLALVPPAGAQPASEAPPLYLGSARVPTRVVATAVYQRVEDGGAVLEQVATPVAVFVPVTRDVGLSVRAAYAEARGTGLETVGGLTDAQLALSARRAVGAGTVVATLGVNVPGGGARRTAGEAATAFLMGQGFYGFRHPSLGQGLNVAPGVTWAVPVGGRVAVGLGASYQHRGAFEPWAESDTRYDPGGEVLLTAGADVQTGEASSLALDVTYARYGADDWGGRAYRSGDAVAVTGQWAGGVGPHEVLVLGRVRVRGEAEGPAEAAVLRGPDATVPTQARTQVSARLRVWPRGRLGVMVQGRHYAASAAFGERTVLDVGLAPEVALTRSVTLLVRGRATVGDLRGVESTAGLAWSF